MSSEQRVWEGLRHTVFDVPNHGEFAAWFQNTVDFLKGILLRKPIRSVEVLSMIPHYSPVKSLDKHVSLVTSQQRLEGTCLRSNHKISPAIGNTPHILRRPIATSRPLQRLLLERLPHLLMGLNSKDVVTLWPGG